MARETLLGLDRILVTSPWAEGVMRRTLGDQACAQRGLTWMPHAINMEVFNGNTSMDVGNDRDRDRSSRHSVGKQIDALLLIKSEKTGDSSEKSAPSSDSVSPT